MNKLTSKQKIERAHISLMRNKNWVWLAPTCMIGNVHIDKSCPTAATDGRDCWYGADFLDKCDDAQVRATVVHENMHKAFRHMVIFKHLVDKHGPQIVNQAMDYVINRYIKKDELSTPSGEKPYLRCWDGIIEYCYNPKYDDEFVWDTPRIVEDLLKNPPPPQGGGGGGGAGKGQGSHDAHDWEGAAAIDGEEAEALAKEIEQAIRQGEVLSRKMAGNAPREVGEMLAPVVDWRQALRDFVTERARGGDYATYAKPNRRFIGYNMYMPSTYTETVKSILFACDTSGSISAEALREVLSEVQGCLEIVKPETVDVMYWDTAVARHEHYEGADVETVLQSTKPAGGGGTSPSCVVGYCNQKGIKPAVVIWLSDGYVGGDWGEGLGVPSFWVISSGGQLPSHLPHVELPRRF
jgi:predicted metal-dependent peptidase